jgi:hypothetical protein
MMIFAGLTWCSLQLRAVVVMFWDVPERASAAAVQAGAVLRQAFSQHPNIANRRDQHQGALDRLVGRFLISCSSIRAINPPTPINTSTCVWSKSSNAMLSLKLAYLPTKFRPLRAGEKPSSSASRRCEKLTLPGFCQRSWWANRWLASRRACGGCHHDLNARAISPEKYVQNTLQPLVLTKSIF